MALGGHGSRAPESACATATAGPGLQHLVILGASVRKQARERPHPSYAEGHACETARLLYWRVCYSSSEDLRGCICAQAHLRQARGSSRDRGSWQIEPKSSNRLRPHTRTMCQRHVPRAPTTAEQCSRQPQLIHGAAYAHALAYGRSLARPTDHPGGASLDSSDRTSPDIDKRRVPPRAWPQCRAARVPSGRSRRGRGQAARACERMPNLAKGCGRNFLFNARSIESGHAATDVRNVEVAVRFGHLQAMTSELCPAGVGVPPPTQPQ